MCLFSLSRPLSVRLKACNGNIAIAFDLMLMHLYTVGMDNAESTVTFSPLDDSFPNIRINHGAGFFKSVVSAFGLSAFLKINVYHLLYLLASITPTNIRMADSK